MYQNQILGLQKSHIEDPDTKLVGDRKVNNISQSSW